MYRLVASLSQPLAFGFFCAILATLLLWRKRRGRRRRLIVATAILLLFAFACTDLVSHCVLRSLESSYVQREAIPDDVSTIVVLGGGVSSHRDSHPKGVELSPSSIKRCINAAELYHARKKDGQASGKNCAILLSGRHADPEYSG
ncbi:MAG: hypothetical protein U9N87_08285, partial [Planctomycetota bacterium]|nr:hypothetical protein [Planctomycetota bacterium]